MRKSDDQLRITLPISHYQWLENSEALNGHQQDLLYQFEINGLAVAQARLVNVGTVSGNSSALDSWVGSHRGILHDDALFYVHGEAVTGDFWSRNPKQ
jgi:hypothetical protein